MCLERGDKMKQFIKVFLAGIVAFIVLNIIFIPYNTTPVHIENKKGNTDYVWMPNSIYMRMTEGISHGRYDENGFNNLDVVENPDILILGSSHMESANVNQNESTAYYLSKYYEDKYSVYNMGISGHEISKVLQYLPDSLNYFNKVPRYVVIETWNLDFDVEGIINKTIKKTKSNSTGLISYLQRLPLLRTLYFQYDQGLLTKLLYGTDTNTGYESVNKTDNKDFKSDFRTVLNYISCIEKEFETKIMIVYHFNETLNDDGTITFNKTDNIELFELLSKEYNVSFVDASIYFEEMYKEENILPHGFVTGKLGEGHLNKYGHKAFSEAVIETIKRLDK